MPPDPRGLQADVLGRLSVSARRIVCFWFLLDRHDLAFKHAAFVTVDLAEGRVLRLPTIPRQQPHYEVHSTWDQRVRSTGRGSHGLPRLEAMVRHHAHLRWGCSGRNRRAFGSAGDLPEVPGAAPLSIAPTTTGPRHHGLAMRAPVSVDWCGY